LKRLESVWFENDTRQYARLARVLEATARRHLPGWEVNVRGIKRDLTFSRVLGESASSNTQKLEEWARIAASAPEGDLLALLDADTFLTATLDPVWDLDFDVALTERAGSHLPLNGGVIFLRAGARARDFMKAWAETNRELFCSPKLLDPWRKRYGGMNQAALGKVLETRPPGGAKVLRLPCLEWNCEDSSWAQFDPARTRVIHVKSALRTAAFGMDGAFGPVAPLMRLWRAEERALGSYRASGPDLG